MAKKLKAAVIGLGMGKGHIKGFQAHPNAEVAAVCDNNRERLEQTANDFSVVGRYTDHNEMLQKEKLDIVSIALPNFLHKPVSIDALEAGCHVLCEKPMAMNAQEGRDMAEAAKQAGKRLMIHFNQRFSGNAMTFKEEIEAGRLGNIYYGHTSWLRRRGMPGFGGWFGQKAMSGGGPLIDLGVHRLDLALWLMGYPKPTYVAASTYDHIAQDVAKRQEKAFDVEDLATAFIKFANGATLILEASWAGHMDVAEAQFMRLLGTRGGLTQRDGCEFHYEKDGCLYDTKLVKRTGGGTNPKAHFVDCILQNQPHMGTPEEGITVMEILDAVYRSAETGKPVWIQDSFPDSREREGSGATTASQVG